MGSNLALAAPFDAAFRSTDIDQIRGREFSLVICAGLSAAKWIANREPLADREKMESLVKAVGEAKIEEFVVISTVDVYPDPREVDEDTEIDRNALSPYGAHRQEFEVFVERRFPKPRIIRLPGLFGPGLRKNAIFDLLHDHELEKLNPSSRYQWFDIRRLWDTIQRVREADLTEINISTEPLAMSEIIESNFPGADLEESAPSVYYDMRSRHAEMLGGRSGYILSKNEVLQDISTFVRGVREGRVSCGLPYPT
ncbi:MAG: NAD-dependent epimerase/dehydratase family protein [Actinomycetota bacterium]